MQIKVDPDDWHDNFYLQSKLALLALTFPNLRIIWSSSPHETVRILSDLKLNHDEPDEMTCTLKGQAEGEKSMREQVENPAAVEMLRAIPGVNSYNLKYVMSKIESLSDMIKMSKGQLTEVLGEDMGWRAYNFIHKDGRRLR